MTYEEYPPYIAKNMATNKDPRGVDEPDATATIEILIRRGTYLEYSQRTPNDLLLEPVLIERESPLAQFEVAPHQQFPIELYGRI